MSQFTFNDYQKAVSAAQNKGTSVKVGWFKLAEDLDTALVRFNVASVEDLQFATVHQLGAATRWMKVSCLNQLGVHEDNCPLCRRAAAGDTTIGKADKHVFIQMLVSYQDRTTKQWSAPQPVIWDKKASYSREIANKLNSYGDLRNMLFTIVRQGKHGDKATTYSVDPVFPNHPVLKAEMIPADFSAFTNFKVNKHSYWEKTVDEIETFLQTGSFPEVVKDSAYTTPSTQQVADAYAAQTPAAPAVQETVNVAAQNVAQPTTQAPAQEATQTTPNGQAKFGNFTF